MNSTIQKTLDLILAGQASFEDGQKILVSRVNGLEYSISDITENVLVNTYVEDFKKSGDIAPAAIWEKKGLNKQIFKSFPEELDALTEHPQYNIRLMTHDEPRREITRPKGMKRQMSPTVVG